MSPTFFSNKIFSRLLLLSFVFHATILFSFLLAFVLLFTCIPFFLFFSLCCFFFHMLLFSSLCVVFFFARGVVLLFTHVAFFFACVFFFSSHALLVFFLREFSFFCTLLLSSSHSYLVLLFFERAYITPPPFLLVGWESSRVENLMNCFSSKYIFSFFSFLLFIFLYFLSFFLFMVQGLLRIILETNINPLNNFFDSFISLLACKCFASLLIMHRYLVNVLHHTYLCIRVSSRHTITHCICFLSFFHILAL